MLRGPTSSAFAIAIDTPTETRNLRTDELAGGLFTVDVDCTADAAQLAFSRMVTCQLPFVSETGTCMRSAMSEYRIARVDCTRPDETMIAEYDATELWVEDQVPGIDLEMLKIEAEEIVDDAEQEIEELNKDGQVVDIARPAVEDIPDEADYLAEFDSNPVEETKKSGTPGGAVIPTVAEPDREKNPDEGTAPEAPAIAPPGGSSMTMRAPGTEGEPAIERPEAGKSFGFERMTENGIGAIRSATRTDPTAPIGGGGSDGAGVGKTTPGTMPHNLRLSKEAYDRSAGGTNDHLPGVEFGDFTSLRSRKWKYASFFNRVKRQVAQNWNPEAAYRMRDPNGNVYGTKDRLTVLQVSLTSKGELAKVLVSEPSGVDFLDDEAIKAFRAAEPFPNPPRGLVDAESRLITFRFGFSFEINSSTPWKVFRYRH